MKKFDLKSMLLGMIVLAAWNPFTAQAWEDGDRVGDRVADLGQILNLVPSDEFNDEIKDQFFEVVRESPYTNLYKTAR